MNHEIVVRCPNCGYEEQVRITNGAPIVSKLCPMCRCWVLQKTAMSSPKKIESKE